MKITNINSYSSMGKYYCMAVSKIELSIELMEKGTAGSTYLEFNLQNLGTSQIKFFDHMLDLMDLSSMLHFGMKIRGETLVLLISKEKKLVDAFELMAVAFGTHESYRKVHGLTG